TAPDPAVRATAGSDITATEGASTGDIVVATFTDATPGDHTGDFTASINWGDGNTSTGTVSYDAGTATYSVTGSNTYADEGSFAVAVHIADLGGASAEDRKTAV